MYEVDMKSKYSDTIDATKENDAIDIMEKINEEYSKLLKRLEKLEKLLK